MPLLSVIYNELKRTKIKEKFVALDNYLINYIELGEGIPIVLIHGLASSLRSWDQNIEYLSKFGKVYALDLPGCGNSSKPNEIINSEKMAQILYLWFKKMKIEKACLIGHSFGGEVCLWFVSSHPEMLKSMVLSSSISIKNKVSVFSRFVNILIDGTLEELWDFPILLKDFKKAGLWRIFSTMFSASSSSAILLKKLSLIQIPVLILSGSKDPVVTIEESIGLTGLFPNAKLKIITGTHGLMFNSPDDFNEEIMKFFAQQDSKSFNPVFQACYQAA